jgi:hypothetical protein
LWEKGEKEYREEEQTAVSEGPRLDLLAAREQRARRDFDERERRFTYDGRLFGRPCRCGWRAASQRDCV